MYFYSLDVVILCLKLHCNFSAFSVKRLRRNPKIKIIILYVRRLEPCHVTRNPFKYKPELKLWTLVCKA